jgi:predicted Zn-dependent protease
VQDYLTWIIAAAVAVSAIAGSLIFARVRVARFRRALARVEQAPAEALPILEPAARRLRARVERLRGRGRPLPESLARDCQRALVGVAVCLIRLGRVQEAGAAWTATRALGALGALELRQLCAAWLDANLARLSDEALADLVDYVSLPEEQQNREVLDKALADLRARLELSERAPTERIEEVVRIGRKLQAAAPRYDWALFALGRALQQGGLWSESLAPLEQAAAAAPDLPERHRALGLSRWAANHRLPARTSFLVAHRISHDAADAFNAGAACLRTANDPLTEQDGAELAGQAALPLALRLLQEATEKQPELLRNWTTRAHAELQSGNVALAATCTERALALDGSNLEARSLLARCRLAEGNSAAAMEMLEGLLQAAGEDPAVAHLAGDVAYDAGNLSAARGHYQRVKPRPPDAGFARRLARCELEFGNPQTTIALLAEAGTLDAESRLVLARAQARTGNWPEALAQLQAAPGQPLTAEHRYYLGAALAANQRYEEAERIFDGLSRDPQWRGKARRQWGHIRLLRGDDEGAQALYAADDGAPAWNFDLGRLALLRGDAELAIEHFQHEAQALEDRNGANAPTDGRLLLFARALAGARLGDTAELTGLARDSEYSAYVHEALADGEYEQGHYRQAMSLYEEAIRGQQRVSTAVLTRLATGTLQLNRFREALPHLVEIARRRPEDRSIQENLAYCRFQLGRENFRAKRWDAAQLQCGRARQLLVELGSDLAPAVERWELEAQFRAAAALLTSLKARQADRAAAMFAEGARRAPGDARWLVGLGLARSELNEHEGAVDAFEKAAACAPHLLAAGVGCGLSLIAAGRPQEGCQALEQTIGRMNAAGNSAGNAVPRGALLELVSRFALGAAYARQNRWQEAAKATEALIGHALIQSSKRISDRDVAQAAVAYHALAGQKSRAAELAGRYLKGETGGQVLIAMVQAEAGDYAGAAQSLEGAFDPKAQKPAAELYVSCLLSAAAERIRAGKLDEADALVAKALTCLPQHKGARRLKEALDFALRLGKLDLTMLDQAIAECKKLLKGNTSSGLVRTLAVLLHRKAFRAEREAGSSEKAWEECCELWMKRILAAPAFWQTFLEEYNAGKGKRERVSAEELEKFRADLPQELAKDHVELVVEAIKGRQRDAARRHLQLMSRWSPKCALDAAALQKAVGQVDEPTAEFLQGLLGHIGDKQARELVGTLVANCWAGKALEHLKQMEVQCTILNKAIAMANAMGPMGMQVLRETIVGALRSARAEANRAREFAAKAKKAAPENKDFATFHETCNKHYHDLDALCGKAGV